MNDCIVVELKSVPVKPFGETTDRAAKLDAFDYPQVYFYNAVANFNLKNYAAVAFRFCDFDDHPLSAFEMTRSVGIV